MLRLYYLIFNNTIEGLSKCNDIVVRVLKVLTSN